LTERADVPRDNDQARTAAAWGGLAASTAVIVWWWVAGVSVSPSGPGPTLLFVAAGLAAAFAGFRVARPSDAQNIHRAWQLFALAAVVVVVGDALLLFTPAASALRDAARLLVLVPFAVATAGLVLVVAPLPRVGERATHLIDVALVTVGVSMVAWEFVLRDVAVGITRDPSRVASVTIGIGHIVLLAGVASLLLRSPSDTRRRSYLTLGAAHLALLISDLPLQLFDAAAGLHTPGRALYLGLILVAALIDHHSRVPGRREDVLGGRRLAALPYVAATAGGLALLVGAVRGGPGLVPLALGAAVLVGLATARVRMAQSESTRLRREHAVLAHDARFRSLVEQSADLIFVVDATWTVTFTSPSVPAALGYRTGQMLGTSVLDLLHPDQVADAGTRLRECLTNARAMRGQWRMRRNDQTYVHTETVCTNLMGDPHIRGIVLTARDVTERTSLEEQLKHRAFHDPLTGLANRALFSDRVQHSLARRRSDTGRLGVVFMDLDYFKAVNDELGHAAGDALLRAAAQRLVSGLRAFDTAARLGGDEFAVLIDDIPRDEEVMHVAERITRAFGEPFVFDGREITTSASVGVALATTGQGAEDLLRNADLAMYLAKKQGRGRAVLFEPAMHAAATTRHELQSELRYALERNQLSLVYHPIHALDTQVMIGAEALLRWVHPSHGPIPPSTFVPIAEEAGLMVDIGHWVLRTACHDAQAWRTRAAGPLPLRVWINLSIRQLPEEDLFDHVADAISASGIVPGAVVLELTERMLLQHQDRALDLMARLKSLGIDLAIDDFGTGYSSLSHLQRLPIDVLKIDRTFVDAIASDEHASTLARTVVSLGQLMSLDIVAEGIESQEQAERLRELGVNAGQGYLFGRPMAAADLPVYAERYRTFTAV
jgi:diguanylate cyclase (GGDEF)-like protein/PAS domain S-box-containing protein